MNTLKKIAAKESHIDGVTKLVARRLEQRRRQCGGQDECDHERSLDLNGVKLKLQLTVFTDCKQLLVSRHSDGALLATLQSCVHLVRGFTTVATTRKRSKVVSASDVEAWPSKPECDAVSEVFARWPDTSWLMVESSSVEALAQTGDTRHATENANDCLAAAS